MSSNNMIGMIKRNLFGIVSFVIPLVIYISTLAPTVYFIDSGELLTDAIKLTIAHPTGYPLFTIIGKVLSLLPLFEPAYRMNLVFAIISAVGCFVFFKYLLLLFAYLKPDFSSGTLFYEIISASSTLTLAFSSTFWSSANHADVFGLQILIISVLLYVFTNAVLISRYNLLEGLKHFILFAFLLGLGFGNHLSLIFMSVGLIYFYFANFGISESSVKRLLIMVVPFLIGLSIYLYLPVRSPNSLSNWGNPHTWSGFWGHITGKQFSVWMFSGTENMKKQFDYFLSMYPKEFFYFPLLIAFFGIFNLFKLNRTILNLTVLLFVSNIVYAINYDIYDIDNYFLLAFITTGIWITYGFDFILMKFSAAKVKFAVVTFLIPLIVITVHFKELDKSSDYSVEEYTFNIFETAPKNSVIYSSQWDFFVAASYYYRYIKNIRPDLIILDKELMRKSWYMDYIKSNYGEIYNRSFLEFEEYKTELLKFEKSPKRYTNPSTQSDYIDLKKIQEAFLKLQNSIVDKNIDDRQFFTTFEVEQNQIELFGQKYYKIPEGVLIRYAKINDSPGNPGLKYKYTIPKGEGYHHSFIRNAYIQGFLNRANYLINQDRLEEASELLDKVNQIEPGNPDMNRLENVINQMKSNREKGN